MLIFFISAFSAIVTILLWIKDEWKSFKSEKSYYKILYPIVFVFLSLTAIFQHYKISEMNKIENEAAIISNNWPSIEQIKFLSKGERLGIIFAGQIFLEKHHLHFWDTYRDFQSLKKGRLGQYSPKGDFSESLKEYDDLEDVCGATITIIKNLAKKDKY